MTRLSDDCFAFGGRIARLDEVLAMIKSTVGVPGSGETVMLDVEQAVGRVVCRDIRAQRNVPPYRNSAVDGFGVRICDLKADGETRLGVRGRIVAGSDPKGQFQPGTACRIFTGAPVPDGVDTVFMQEDVSFPEQAQSEQAQSEEKQGEAGGACPFGVFPSGLPKGANLRAAGEDVRAGSLLIPAGTRLMPPHLGLLAGQGMRTVACFRKLRVGVFSTGSEMRGTPDDQTDPHRHETGQAAVYDANSPALIAAIRNTGLCAGYAGHVVDDLMKTRAFLTAAAGRYDVLVSTGGVSLGEEDYIRPALESVGRITSWRVALKPGRPVTIGEIGSTPFVGLPGNPVAAIVTFVTVVIPLLRKLQGVKRIEPQHGMALPVFDIAKKPNRLEFLRVTEQGFDATGRLKVQIHPKKGAGILSSVTQSDGLLAVPEEVTHLKAGDRAFPYYRFSDLFGGFS